MTIDENGILHRSYVGGCSKYDPDKTKPHRVKAHDVEGLEIYDCLNCKPTAEGERLHQTCGKGRCDNHMEKKR
ncbi:hypothetical protein HN832_04090 [archaeon]|jgi:hypothetical protein|nr:hypothetical protein [archaeon]MBT4373425.1 hypothetical protein [archaeon]MBT4531873.1 hypothetical protein [archaeon]MBT7001540.1 hypothetical protein [archaeon]MBT7282568.1 hypothetical protein [archaeon]